MTKLLNGVYEFRTKLDEIVSLMALELMEDTEATVVQCMEEDRISAEQFEARKASLVKLLA